MTNQTTDGVTDHANLSSEVRAILDLLEVRLARFKSEVSDDIRAQLSEVRGDIANARKDLAQVKDDVAELKLENKIINARIETIEIRRDAVAAYASLRMGGEYSDRGAGYVLGPRVGAQPDDRTARPLFTW